MALDPSQLSQEQIAAFNQYAGVFGYQPTNVLKTLLLSPCKTNAIFAGNRYGKGECLTALTLIDTIEGRVSIGDLYSKKKPFYVCAWDGEKKVMAKASAPFKKPGGPRPCYRITMADGRWIECSGGHRILTTSGEFCNVSEIYDSFQSAQGKKLFSEDVNISHAPSYTACQSTHALDGRHWSEKLSDFLYGCLAYLHLCGGRLPLLSGSDLVSVPLSCDARLHNDSYERRGDLDNRYANIPQLKHVHPSNLDAYLLNVGRFFESLTQTFCTKSQQFSCEPQGSSQHYPVSSDQLQSFALDNQHLRESSLASLTPKVLCGNKIVSIEPIASQEVYDLTVPIYHNYVTASLIHHNTLVMDWYYRIECAHPQDWKNIKPTDKHRTLRVCCESLPEESTEEDTKNTIFPIMQRRYPQLWTRKKMTARDKTWRLVNPRVGGKPVSIEFSSYSQDVQRQAGVDRRAIMQDEESNLDYFEEQSARTMNTGGDVLIGFTPVPGSIGWMYDQIYERARIIYRTKAVRERILKRYGEKVPAKEETGSKEDICVIFAATDDNPTFNQLAREFWERDQDPKNPGRHFGQPLLTGTAYLDSFFATQYGDEDVIDARRYGLFRQLSGKVFKVFNDRVHVISGQKYFPNGQPYDWKHFRGIDYHQKNPWAGIWLSVSPADEIFVYRDASWQPGRMTTYDIVDDMVSRSGNYKFRKDLIDPLANTKQSNTNRTTIQDLNDALRTLKNQDRGTGGYFIPWDTKGTRGREEFTKRLINAQRVGRPFNNTVEENGHKSQLPTIWFLDDVKVTIDCMRQWRYEQWESRGAEQRNDEKEKPQQKHSHWPICIESMLKENDVSHARFTPMNTQPVRPKHYFQAMR